MISLAVVVLQAWLCSVSVEREMLCRTVSWQVQTGIAEAICAIGRTSCCYFELSNGIAVCSYTYRALTRRHTHTHHSATSSSNGTSHFAVVLYKHCGL
jgi:hypothetical protein